MSAQTDRKEGFKIPTLKGRQGISQFLIKNLPFAFFIGVLALSYIYNVHHAHKQIRTIHYQQQELKQLNWKYMSLKSEFMRKSKQSEVARRVEELGLKELTEQPKKINLSENGS